MLHWDYHSDNSVVYALHRLITIEATSSSLSFSTVEKRVIQMTYHVSWNCVLSPKANDVGENKQQWQAPTTTSPTITIVAVIVDADRHQIGFCLWGTGGETLQHAKTAQSIEWYERNERLAVVWWMREYFERDLSDDVDKWKWTTIVAHFNDNAMECGWTFGTVKHKFIFQHLSAVQKRKVCGWTIDLVFLLLPSITQNTKYLLIRTRHFQWHSPSVALRLHSSNEHSLVWVMKSDFAKFKFDFVGWVLPASADETSSKCGRREESVVVFRVLTTMQTKIHKQHIFVCDWTVKRGFANRFHLMAATQCLRSFLEWCARCHRRRIFRRRREI